MALLTLCEVTATTCHRCWRLGCFLSHLGRVVTRQAVTDRSPRRWSLCRPPRRTPRALPHIRPFPSSRCRPSGCRSDPRGPRYRPRSSRRIDDLPRAAGAGRHTDPCGQGPARHPGAGPDRARRAATSSRSSCTARTTPRRWALPGSATTSRSPTWRCGRRRTTGPARRTPRASPARRCPAAATATARWPTTTTTCASLRRSSPTSSTVRAAAHHLSRDARSTASRSRTTSAAPPPSPSRSS